MLFLVLWIRPPDITLTSAYREEKRRREKIRVEKSTA